MHGNLYSCNLHLACIALGMLGLRAELRLCTYRRWQHWELAAWANMKDTSASEQAASQMLVIAMQCVVP